MHLSRRQQDGEAQFRKATRRGQPACLHSYHAFAAGCECHTSSPDFRQFAEGETHYSCLLRGGHSLGLRSGRGSACLSLLLAGNSGACDGRENDDDVCISDALFGGRVETSLEHYHGDGG